MKTLHKHIATGLIGLFSLALSGATPALADSAADVAPSAGIALAGAPESPCEDTRSLEPRASMGLLTADQVVCLENRLAETALQTGKDKLSLILMANAYSSGDRAQWEQRVQYHLDEIDQSNADLCFKYALHLYRKGGSHDLDVIRWAETSLDNRFFWQGRIYKSRVNGLKKLKAQASRRIWMNAVDVNDAYPTPENAAKVEKARNRTKVLSREWLEYANKSGQDYSKALQVCLSAAGTDEYCEYE